jgi:DNA-binding NtrC family response regulator
MVHSSSVFHTLEENFETLEQSHEKSFPFDSAITPRQMQTVLLATNDSDIRESMSELLQGYEIKTLLASGMEEIKSALAKGNVSACFCGFWLVDGTFRDIVRHMKRQREEIPVVVVCAPACPDEYHDYLAALNIRAFDFISYPYRRSDVERILGSTVAPRKKLVQMPTKGVDCLDGSFGPSQLHRAS